ncbi:hypothetical protein PRIPAC_75133 [Pristionchus pacificus]|uniref:Membrane transporter n=1 Tax=Pristionchus pacificus TaxID=54126 RepID=A0A2A6CRY6_PRIPA|nr:hypothetical protein PRIPAC_75133 [Pristionchus pacificus]|eukprot:PDM80827.1 membrane transporter [Pristionchus pacificus]
MIIIVTLIVFVVFVTKSTCRRGSKSDVSSSLERSSLPTSIIVMTATTDPSSSTRKDVEGVLSQPTEYKVYPMRWFILMTVNLLALSNATMWMTYTSSTEATARFYCNMTEESPKCEISLWTSQIFQLMGTILGIMGMYVTDKYGIKVSTRAGCILNLAGALIRIISSLPMVPLESRAGVLHVGTVIVSSAQPFFLVLSPKVAEYWFPEDQRALSNVLSFIANPLGVALGTIIPVFIMNKDTVTIDSYQFLILNVILTSVPLIAFIMSMIIKSGTPPTPCCASSDNHNAPDFCKALGMLIKNPHFYVILIVFGGAFGQLWAVYTASDSLLNQLGYSPSVTGYTVVVACAFGVGLSLLFGMYVDKTKKFKEVIRVCMCGFFLTSVAFNVITRYQPGDNWFFLPLIFILNALLGICSIPVFPIGIELGIEATYPVQEATSSGLLVIIGQLELFLIITVMNVARTNQNIDFVNIDRPGYQNDKNYFLANDIWCGIALVSALIALFLLNPPYKRLAFEKEHKEKSMSDRSNIEKGSISPSPSIKSITPSKVSVDVE